MDILNNYSGSDLMFVLNIKENLSDSLYEDGEYFYLLEHKHLPQIPYL